MYVLVYTYIYIHTYIPLCIYVYRSARKFIFEFIFKHFEKISKFVIYTSMIYITIALTYKAFLFYFALAFSFWHSGVIGKSFEAFFVYLFLIEIVKIGVLKIYWKFCVCFLTFVFSIFSLYFFLHMCVFLSNFFLIFLLFLSIFCLIFLADFQICEILYKIMTFPFQNV